MHFLTTQRNLLRLFLALFLAAAGTTAQAGFVPGLGSPRVLVILINYNNTTTTYTPGQLDSRIFGTGVGSIADYYRDVSYNQLSLQGDVFGWYTASQSHDYYSPGTYGRNSNTASYYQQNMFRLAEEAVDAAEAAGVDFSLYDNDGDGEAEAVIVIHQGEGGEINQHPNDIWSNMIMISSGGGQARKYDGVTVDALAMLPEISPWGGIVNIGPVAHEFGHLLGMTDLYDMDGSSNGIGQYDLMSRGWQGANPKFYDPDHPTHPSPRQKALLGWITPTLVTPATQGAKTLPAFETNPFILKVPADPENSKEYFLLANYTRTGNHAALPTQGLTIWHVNERALFQNDYESKGCSTFFPRVALEQADGRFDLENKLNWGDTTDAYPGGGAFRSFDDSTTPKSRNYACHLTGIAVRNISDPADPISADITLDTWSPGLSAPDLKIISYQVVPMTGDGDQHFESGERFQLLLTLTNDGATATGVTATLNLLPNYYTLNQNTSSFPNLAPGASATGSSAFDFTFQSNLTFYQQSYWWFSLSANGGAYTKSLLIYYRIGDPPILYVDDDGGLLVDNFIKYGLNFYNYFYDYWEVSKQGPPTVSGLAPYSQVIWITGADRPSPLSAAEQSAIAGYLDGNGRLILSSPYFLVNPSAGDTAFAKQYLHLAGYLDDHYAVERIRGINNDPLSNDSVSFIYKLGLPYFPLYNRTVGLIPGANAAGSVLNDYDHFTAIRYPEPYLPGPRVIFFSYALESLFSRENSLLLRRILNALSYQTGEPFIFNISPSSGQLKKLDLVLTVTGMNFQPSTTFSFPRGGITVTNLQYVSAKEFKVTVRIAYNAPLDYHTVSAQNPSGPAIVEDKYFSVNGPLLPNQKPVANAGSDQSGYRSDSFILQGSGSDPDYDDPIRYQWTRIQGPAVTLLPGNTAAQPGFIPNPAYSGKYVFSLVVYDALNLAGDADTVAVTVLNHPPVAEAGQDQAGYRGAPFILDGASSSDPEGDPLTYQWTQVQGAPITLLPGSTARSPSFNPAYAGDYVFSLKVHDGYDLSAADTVKVTVLNQPPVAEAGPDQFAEVLQKFTFDAGLSSDPEDDPIQQYSWVQLQGFPVTLNTNDPVHPYFYAPQIGIYIFSLQVFDGWDWSLNADTVQAEATKHYNHAPVAIAGPNRQGYRADSFLLDGSGSYDPDAEPITYQWTQLQGPPLSLLPGATAIMPTFNPLREFIGRYVFSLQVFDDWDLSASDTVGCQVVNHLPVAWVGPDQVGQRGQIITLDAGLSSDLDGDTLLFLWTQSQGPAVTLDTLDPARPSFQANAFGNYVFDIRINDGFDLSSNQEAVEIIVTSRFNQMPVPVPGPNQTVTFYNPAPVQLDGTGSYDPDGTIQGYAWAFESRPAGSLADFSDSSSSRPTFYDDVPGDYPISLRVKDNEVWSFKAYTTVTSDANRDSDGDTIPDYLDPDDDNDQMSDTWEISHGLNAYDPADGDTVLNPVTDPDNDGNLNLNEFFNESDPQAAEPVCNLAGCFFTDGDGNQSIGVPDLDLIALFLGGAAPDYSSIFPPNGDTQDLDGNNSLGVPDLDLYASILSGELPSLGGFPGPITLVEPAGATPSVSVGATIRLVAEARALDTGTPRSGLAAVFEVISGSGNWLGGDGDAPARRNFNEMSSLNSPLRDSVFSLSRDGLEIFLASYRAGGLGGFDIYRAVRNSVNEPFGPLLNLSELNTTLDDTGPSISADRLTLYFCKFITSTNPDLFYATRPALDQPFGPAQPISELNTAGYQLFPMPNDDELHLYYVYYNGDTWKYDLFLATRPNKTSPFTANSLATLDTSYHESFPYISSDELTIVFSSTRPGKKAGWNLWMSTRTSVAVPFPAPVEVERINTNGEEYDSQLSSDGLELTFTSTGHGGLGETDIFQVTRASTALPFTVTNNPGRYDITGPMSGSGGQNSYGRAVLRFQPTAPGLIQIIVTSPADLNRLIPSCAVEKIITIQAQ